MNWNIEPWMILPAYFAVPLAVVIARICTSKPEEPRITADDVSEFMVGWPFFLWCLALDVADEALFRVQERATQSHAGRVHERGSEPKEKRLQRSCRTDGTAFSPDTEESK
jgi:hypothetical protein